MLNCLSFPPLAQWLEQKTHNLLVVGSSPSGGTRSLRISGTFLFIKKTRFPGLFIVLLRRIASLGSLHTTLHSLVLYSPV